MVIRIGENLSTEGRQKGVHTSLLYLLMPQACEVQLDRR